jgi:3alpha(or 20beta)-hydroxysteroid dehydrogenase
MKAALPSMRKAGGGSIVNISSSMGLISSIKVFAYSAAKFAVRGMSKAAAIELGSENIRVNTVFPGSIRTPAFEEFITIAGDVSDSLLTGRVPLKRVAKIDEVTGMVIFLASDESSYCTGGDFAVDGGLTAG